MFGMIEVLLRELSEGVCSHPKGTIAHPGIQIHCEHVLRKALLELPEVLFDEASEEGL